MHFPKSMLLHLGVSVILFAICAVSAESEQILAMLASMSILWAITLGFSVLTLARSRDKMLGLMKEAYIEMPAESRPRFEDAIRKDTGYCPNFVIFGLNCEQRFNDGMSGGCSACGEGLFRRKNKHHTLTNDHHIPGGATNNTEY